jgi:hypothetical protein
LRQYIGPVEHSKFQQSTQVGDAGKESCDNIRPWFCKIGGGGRRPLAQRIVAGAEVHGITRTDNGPLARAPYASVDLDDELSPEHYQVVVEVVGRGLALGGLVMPGDRRRNE